MCVYTYTYIVFRMLSCIRHFAIPWSAARQASLFFTISQSLFKLITIESVNAKQPSHPLLTPSPPTLNISQHQGHCQWVIFFSAGGQSIRASASAPVFSMHIQGWFPLGLTGLISLLARDPQECSPAPQFKRINPSALTLLYGSSLCSHIHTQLLENHSFDYLDLYWQHDISVS